MYKKMTSDGEFVFVLFNLLRDYIEQFSFKDIEKYNDIYSELVKVIGCLQQDYIKLNINYIELNQCYSLVKKINNEVYVFCYVFYDTLFFLEL